MSDHTQQKFNIKAVRQGWNRFSDLYDKRHPQASGKITDYTGTIGSKRGY